MPDRILPGPVASGESAAEQNCPKTDCVNVHINKIYDACREEDIAPLRHSH